jgi:hypothetical protein
MKILVDREALEIVIGAAENHRNDLSSGLADGTYEEGEAELEALEAALDTLAKEVP